MKNRQPQWKLLLFIAIGIVLWNSLSTGRQVHGATPRTSSQPEIALYEYARGIPEPTDIASTGVPGDQRLFVTRRNGFVYLIKQQGESSPQVILDIDDRVIKAWYEQGLLGIVFDPDFASNGYVYLNYTYYAPTGDPQRGDTHISRFQMDPADPDLIDADSEVVLLTIDQPQENHNGGDMAFGPDGFLYIASGDGQGGGDQPTNAQKKDQLLGKILRIDPSAGPGNPPDCLGDGGGGYTIPASNPFADGPVGDCDEIWAFGLRNPWRISFDPLTGDLFLGDVGDDSWEEIDHQPAESPGGENYGWPCYEGTHKYSNPCTLPSFVAPVFEYPHTDVNAVVGGFVYRGLSFPDLAGTYLFADYDGVVRSLVFDGGGWEEEDQGSFQATFSTWGEDLDGELYVADFHAGVIYRLAYAPFRTFLPQVVIPPGNGLDHPQDSRDRKFFRPPAPFD